MIDQFYVYVSTKCGADCVQTIFLCAPQQDAINLESAEAFAHRSGWIDQVEQNAAILIMPLLSSGWDSVSLDTLTDYFNRHKNDFRSRLENGNPGRDGFLWLWETMIYAVGYDEGADYLGNVLVKHSNFFAGAALVNGATHDFTSASALTDHWFVENPTKDYGMRNQDVPVPVWFFGHTQYTDQAIQYFSEINHVDREKFAIINGIETVIHFNKKEPAQQVCASFNVTGVDPIIVDTVMNEFFNKSLRWKNSPDGTIKPYLGKKEYYKSQRFKHHRLKVHDLDYPYAVHLPEGLTTSTVKGLPLVISLHGRGEPTWVFAEKNGWDKLADETQAFIVVFPDSPYNIWKIERDDDVLEAMLIDLKKTYDYDPERVYLTGFSNGAIFTCQQASTHPWLFAAASPWNGPEMEACRKFNIDSFVYHPDFVSSGYDMPFWIIVGDNDSKASANRKDELEILLPLNGCAVEKEETLDKAYTIENKFEEGDRFSTKIYRNSDLSIRVGLSVMKNMPHGAIFDESRAAWNFMKRFRRPNKNKRVEEVKVK